MKGFGARLRGLRELAHLSQQALADRAGLHMGQVNRYEREVIGPTAEKVILLARALGVSADVLLGTSEEGTPQADIRNPQLYKRFVSLQNLERDDQDTAIKLIDALVAQRKVEQAIAHR